MTAAGDHPSGFGKGEERLIHQGHVVSMAIGTFRGPDGSTYERELVHHPGAVAVVPIVDGDTAVLVRQYRPPLDRLLLEIPAGKRDVEGEPPEVTAQRELEEEIGYRAGRLEPLAVIHNSPGFCDETGYLFLGLDLTETKTARVGLEEEHMTIERVSLHDVHKLIASGALTDAKTIIGLLLARDHLG
jgi:8-oxo-dGTP pyrophosphatase MutT (NUDIX family)